MRLVIDLQGAQGLSRGRGIGRFSQELALAMARAPGPHEPIILLNDAIPEFAEELADAFARLLPRRNIRTWRGLTGCSYMYGSLERRRASELIRAQVIAGLESDLVHVASMVEGAADDVISAWPLSHQRIPTVATFYDAIPLLWPQYLYDPRLVAWYFRHLHELKHCTAVLGISESSRQEAIKHLGRDPSDAYNILAGLDAATFRPIALDPAALLALLARYGLREDFVLFVGAGDLRKNDLGLLQAYAMLPAALRAAHQLVIVGSWNPAMLQEEAAKLGIRQSDLVLPRHVTDSDLPSLYSACRCFVMPSKHEGFGLPALEAMACGTAVIASNTTSLPEVVGLDEALFDPNDPGEIAKRLQRVLTDHAFHARLVSHGLEHAAQFTWAASAERAWSALETVQSRRSPDAPDHGRRGAAIARNPSLAFVGPLPPDASGIAEYSRDLLPSLAEYYEITLVTQSGAIADPALSVFPVMDEAGFAQVADRFDRIVYQAGNSEFHIGIVGALLPRHPGVVVLHDAFLANVPLNMRLRTGDRGIMARALFDSHGWPAVKLLTEEGEWAAALRFPCLMPVLRHALGIVQHSFHARSIVAGSIGEDAGEMVRVVPFARALWSHCGRAAARTALGVDVEAPLACSFGIVAATKRPMDVLEAWHAAFGSDAAALLAFVGHAAPDVAEAIRLRAAELGIGERVIHTGRVDETTYRRWLEAADIAIQLRTASRGETSASIADCMAAGLPVVANAHGSAAELPPDALVLLPDQADAATIGAALSALWQDPARRAVLSGAALSHVRTVMAPAVVARAYRDAIEHFHVHGTAARLRAALPMLPKADLRDAARALTVSFPPPAPPRLLLDASNMAQSDLGTGIQRVIRELGKRILANPDLPATADMVRLDGTTLRYARGFAADLLGLPTYGLADAPVLTAPGDTLVLMDNHGAINPTELGELRRLRRLGARVVAVIYDMLPLQRPEWFPPQALPLLQLWLRETLSIADAALCISRSVADEVIAWLNAVAINGESERRRPLEIGWFHLGSDFRIADEGQEPDAEVDAALAAAAQRPTLLMVGTIEPRKGHAQSLAAFQELWTSGEDVGLTIVGKPGWATEDLQHRLRSHREFGGRLHWLRHPRDAQLARLYRGASGLLMASEGEGFGLPIVEAARAGIPILARDIPVFREIAGEHALWFSGLDSAALATALRRWLDRFAAGTLPTAQGMPLSSWDESAEAFLGALRSDAWPMRWVPPPGAA